MASQEQTYSSDFKAKIALKALEQSKQNLDRLSEEYDVPVSVILSWAAQLEHNAGTLFDVGSTAGSTAKTQGKQTFVNLKTDQHDVSEAIEQGVMSDHLNYKNLLFWAALGLAFVLIFVQLAIEMYQINPHITTRNAAGREYTQLGDQKAEARQKLSNFGVVNIEKGIYRVPIDSVINQMAVEANDMTVEIDSNTAIEVDSDSIP